MAGPIGWLTNAQSDATQDPVSSPAFSLTKVLASGAVIITPIATLLIKWLGDDSFNWHAVHIVALALGLLGFLAITASADVLARGISAGATPSHLDVTNIVQFDKPLRAALKDNNATEVEVLAVVAGRTSYYLVKGEDGNIAWKPTSFVRVRSD
jgi:hypothetical protein